MDRDHLIDLFSEFGPVALRRMFSGYGVVADDVNFALVLRNTVLFRVDDLTRPRFEAEGSKPFQYDARGKTVTVNSYWQLPERFYDDPEELAVWARQAVEVAKRVAATKADAARKPRRSKRPVSKAAVCDVKSSKEKSTPAPRKKAVAKSAGRKKAGPRKS